MKKSKKLCLSAILLAAVMVLTCVSVFAAPSYVAEITKDGVTTQYESLEEAVAAVEYTAFATRQAPENPTTIKLLASTNAGLDIGKSGSQLKNVILDLNTYTLTLGPAIGSTDTETNGIRVLSYSKLEVKNGTIVPSELPNDKGKYVRVAFANYGTLKLTDVTVNSGSTVMYTINNRGNLALEGNTTVPSGQTEPKLAITNDVYDAHYHDDPNLPNGFNASLNIASSNVEVGVVAVERYYSANKEGSVVLNISAGKVEEIKALDNDTSSPLVGNITGGTFTKPVADEYLAEGFEPILDADGNYVVEVPHKHSYGTPKANDAKTHTATCDCGATLTSEHTMKDGVCTDCGYKAGDIISSNNPQTSTENVMVYAVVLMLAGLALAFTAKKCR